MIKFDLLDDKDKKKTHITFLNFIFSFVKMKIEFVKYTKNNTNTKLVGLGFIDTRLSSISICSIDK